MSATRRYYKPEEERRKKNKNEQRERYGAKIDWKKIKE
jgi:hypothetical protein